MGSTKTRTTKKTDLSQWPELKGLLGDMLGKGREIGNLDFKENPFLQLAGFTPDELNAFQGVRDQQGKYDSILESLVNRATNAPNTEEIQKWMDPYNDLVLDDVTRRISEEGDRTQRGISDAGKFVNSFGGSRQAILEAMNSADTSRNIGEATNRGRSDAFNNAMGRYLDSIGIGLGAVDSAQASKFRDLASLENIGRTQRQNSNAQQQLYSEDFLRGQDWPFKQLGALSTASQSFPYDILTQTQTTKQSGSVLNSLLGAATAAAGLATGNPILATSGFSSAMGGGATGSGGGGLGALGSLFGKVSQSGFAEGGMVDGYGNGGMIVPFLSGRDDDSPVNRNGEVFQTSQNPLQTDNASAFGVGTGLRFAPEMLSPPDRGGNPVARLLGMYKEGSRTGGMMPSFAEGGLLSGILGGSSGTMGMEPASGKSGGNWFERALENPLFQIGMNIMASDKPIGQAIGEGFLGYKNTLEAEDKGEGKDLMQALKMQEIMARMGLNEEKFAETQRMNEARLADMAFDNETQRQHYADSLGISLAQLDLQIQKAEEDRRRYDFEHNPDGTRKGTAKTSFSYEGLNDVTKDADKIIGGRPIVGDVKASADDIMNAYDNLSAIEETAFNNGDESTLAIIKPRKEKLGKMVQGIRASQKLDEIISMGR